MTKEIYMTLGRSELVIHIPYSVVVDEIKPTERNKAHFPHLTKREADVLYAIRLGLQYKEIGQRLNLAERTIKFHACNLLKKLGVKSKTEILRQFGLLERVGESYVDFYGGKCSTLGNHSHDPARPAGGDVEAVGAGLREGQLRAPGPDTALHDTARHLIPRLSRRIHERPRKRFPRVA